MTVENIVFYGGCLAVGLIVNPPLLLGLAFLVVWVILVKMWMVWRS